MSATIPTPFLHHSSFTCLSPPHIIYLPPHPSGQSPRLVQLAVLIPDSQPLLSTTPLSSLSQRTYHQAITTSCFLWSVRLHLHQPHLHLRSTQMRFDQTCIVAINAQSELHQWHWIGSSRINPNLFLLIQTCLLWVQPMWGKTTREFDLQHFGSTEI